MKRKLNSKIVKEHKKQKNIYNLHTDGFEIINYNNINSKIIREIKNSGDDGYIIFNDKIRGGDDKRSQSFIDNPNKELNDWKSCIMNLLKEKYPKLIPNDMVVIKSVKGCKKQIPHCDYEQDLSFATAPDDEVPLGCLICIMEETTLDVWIKSHRLAYLNNEIIDNINPIKRTRIKLNIGEILIFRGDLVHAGSSYDKDNYRVHVFLDSEKVDRKENRTWYMNDVDYIQQ